MLRIFGAGWISIDDTRKFRVLVGRGYRELGGNGTGETTV